MGVFVLTDQHQLVAMKSAQFVTEDEFQSLLVNFPELLSGDTAERYTPRRWLLLNREQPVPAKDDGAGRWSIDHLFVDQDEGMWRILQQDEAEDFVLGTGEQHSVREFVELAFSEVGIRIA